MVDNGDLGGSVRGQAVEYTAVGQKNTPPVFVRGRGIVDIGEPPGFAVLAAHLPDAIRVDLLDGNGLLHTAGNGEGILFAAVGSHKGFNQSPIPPFFSRIDNRSSVK